MTNRRDIALRAAPERRWGNSRRAGGRSGAAGRCRRAIAALACCALVETTLPSKVLASAQVLHDTFDLCKDLGQTRDEVGRRLAELGWLEGDSPAATADLMFWAVFARDFSFLTDEALSRMANSEDRGQQLGYMIANASFTSASILGNSALPPDQPNYAQGPYRLAVLGVSLGRGYCVLSGPDVIVAVFQAVPGFAEQWPENVPQSNRTGVNTVFGEAQETTIMTSDFDQAELRDLYTSADIELPYMGREFDLSIFDAAPEAIVHISQKQPE